MSSRDFLFSSFFIFPSTFQHYSLINFKLFLKTNLVISSLVFSAFLYLSIKAFHTSKSLSLFLQKLSLTEFNYSIVKLSLTEFNYSIVAESAF